MEAGGAIPLLRSLSFRAGATKSLGGACVSAAIFLGAMGVICSAGAAYGSDYCAYDFPLDFNPTTITSEDICNFHQVDAQLYRGGRPRPSAYPKLVQTGVRTIINLEEPESAEVEKNIVDVLNQSLSPDKQIQFISVPIGPDEIDESGVSQEKLKYLFGQIQSASKPIFLHCYHGKDRTGMVVVLYRLLTHQKSLSDAYEEAYRYRFSRSDHGLARTIERYKSPKRLRALPPPTAPQ